MIMKVQRPIYPSVKKEWLFYNKKRTILYELIPPVGVVGMMSNSLKMYVKVKLVRGVVTILTPKEVSVGADILYTLGYWCLF